MRDSMGSISFPPVSSNPGSRHCRFWKPWLRRKPLWSWLRSWRCWR